jgi:hypothetical protein
MQFNTRSLEHPEETAENLDKDIWVQSGTRLNFTANISYYSVTP